MLLSLWMIVSQVQMVVASLWMIVSQVQMFVASWWMIVSQVQMFVVAIVDDSITGAVVCCCQPY